MRTKKEIQEGGNTHEQDANELLFDIRDLLIKLNKTNKK